MPLDRRRLIAFLETLGSYLEEDERITLVAVGGTALTLLGTKASTIDVDFTGPREDIDRLDEVLEELPHGLKVDRWPDGTVFATTLPGDYLERARIVEDPPPGIDLRALHPVDLVVTKLGRFDQRDQEDIAHCISTFGLTAEEIRERAGRTSYALREDHFQHNLEVLLSRMGNPG